ncbi:MAG TPA: tetratricopeptide repeat protein [Caldimonas sp.]
MDSTAWAERIGDEHAARLWARHDDEARRLLRLHNGQEVDRTDGFFVLFEDVGEAAAFVVAYHRLAASLGLAARAAVHFAAVMLRRNAPQHVRGGAKPMEVDGIAKPIAARVMALAPAGRTLFTSEAAGELREVLAEGHRLHNQGHYRLKGVVDPLELFELAGPMAAGAPPPDTDKAYRVLRVGEFWRPLREVRHNLVRERDEFVGRQVELRSLAERLESGARLVTVLGPGGIGKTRLVLRYAAAWLGDWPGGVYICDLSEARSLEGIHFAVAYSLGVPLGKDDAGVQLQHVIAARGRCLVVLDNFEQVQAHAEVTVARWLDGAPEAMFVVTSRAVLHVAGETVFALEPLELGGDAVALFEARAKALEPSFAITDANRAQIARIVQLLDGLPLAVELAAARIRVLSPTQIIERIKDRFSLLSGTGRPAARQATLQAAIDWSWSLLSPSERAALAQCSVFDGGFTLRAAEAVLDLMEHEGASPVVDVVHSLLDKSLLHAWTPRTSGRLDIAEPFFGMYLSIHEYAKQKLAAYGDLAKQSADARHGEYFAKFGSDEAQASLLGQEGVRYRRALALELDNLVTASERAIARHDPQIAAKAFLGAWAVFETQGPFNAAAALGGSVMSLEDLTPHHRALVGLATSSALRTLGRIEEAQALLADALKVARQSVNLLDEPLALHQLAVVIQRYGDPAQAYSRFEAALALYEQLDDRAHQGVLLADLANLQMEQGQTAEARVSYERALSLHREVGNPAAGAVALGNLGTLLHELGHHQEARLAYEQALAIHREAGNRLQEAITLCNMGILSSQRGDADLAASHYRDSLAIHREIGNRRGEGVVLGTMGKLYHELAQHEQAREHYQRALLIHREIGNQRFEAGVEANLAMLSTLQGDLASAMSSLERSEQLARQVKALLTLAAVLCMKGEVLVKQGEVEAARAVMAEAERLADELGAQPGSEIHRDIDDLRKLLSA